jgi:glycolate oxidase FAD binding subunit
VATDPIQGVQPGRLVTATTPDIVSATLREASERNQSVVIRGHGTKLAWGRVPRAIDICLDVSALDRVLVHEHGDMTATVEAGAGISAVNDALGRHGQWLPVDGGFAGATIGGMLASADSGPLRHRFGTLRDQIIGVRLVTPDGEFADAGGRVVKNVAGYDLGKLMSGSQGSFAAVVSATFKLAPVLLPSTTLIAEFSTDESLAASAQALASSQLEPVSFDVHVHCAEGVDTRVLMLRFSSTPRAMEAAVDAARQSLGSAIVTEERDATEAATWKRQAQGVWHASGAVARVSWRSAELLHLVAVTRALHNETGAEIELRGRTAVGAGVVRVAASATVQRLCIERLRADRVAVGAVSVLRSEPELKSALDPWGDLGSSGSTLAAIKQAFDPHGVLNAGRGPV